MGASEWLLVVVIGLLVALMIFPTSHRRIEIMARRLMRTEQKIDLILKELNLQPNLMPFDISEKVKILARDPGKKIEAIKLYREETGSGLAEAKEAIEQWIVINAVSSS